MTTSTSIPSSARTSNNRAGLNDNLVSPEMSLRELFRASLVGPAGPIPQTQPHQPHPHANQGPNPNLNLSDVIHDALQVIDQEMN